MYMPWLETYNLEEKFYSCKPGRLIKQILVVNEVELREV